MSGSSYAPTWLQWDRGHDRPARPWTLKGECRVSSPRHPGSGQGFPQGQRGGMLGTGDGLGKMMAQEVVVNVWEWLTTGSRTGSFELEGRQPRVRTVGPVGLTSGRPVAWASLLPLSTPFTGHLCPKCHSSGRLQNRHSLLSVFLNYKPSRSLRISAANNNNS